MTGEKPGKSGAAGQTVAGILPAARANQDRAQELHVARLALLNEIGQQIAAVLNLDELLHQAVDLVRSVFEYHHVAVFTLGRDQASLVMRALSGSFASLFPPRHRVALGQGMVGWAAAHGETLLANNVESEPHYVNYYPDLVPTGSELSVPIRFMGQIIGVLDVQSSALDAFDENDVMVMEAVAGQLAVAIHNAELFGETQQLKVFNETIVQTIPGAIFVTDAPGHLTFVNPAAAELLDFSPEELIGQHRTAIVAPHQRLFVATAIEQRMRGEFGHYETELMRRDGTLVPVLINGSPLLDPETGEIAGFVIVVTDITARKRTEEVLRESEHRLRMMVEHLPAGAVYREGDSLLLNRAVEEITGYSRDEITTVGAWFQALYRDTAEYALASYLADRQAGFSATRTHSIWRPDGQARLVDFAAYRFSEGEVWLLYDVTEREQAKEALRRLNATLEAQVEVRTLQIQAEQQKTGAILRSVGDAIATTSSGLKVIYVNPAFVALTGYQIDEIQGKPWKELLGAGLSAIQQQALDRALDENESWQGELLMRRKDGRTYDADVTFAPMRDDEGTLIGFVLSHRDISHVKELSRARSQFMANVSHQFRTPVTNLKLYAQLLRKGLGPERTERFLQVIEDQVNRLAYLVDDVLEMAELDSGLAAVQWKPLALPMLVTTVVEAWQQQAEERGITLQAEPLPAEMPLVYGDVTRLVQALGELLKNALTFTPEGGRVTVGAGEVAENEQRWATLWVQDTGPGVLPEEEQRIFERLYRGRLAESGQIVGTGLGLSKVQQIVDAHGGRVTVDSQAEAGSRFVLWLRLVV